MSIIVGGEVVGLNIATASRESQGKLKIVVAKNEEKSFLTLVIKIQRNLCRFYYSSESLKSKFCRLGNSELKVFCRDQKMPLLKIGKVVVAKSKGYVKRKEDLLRRMEVNGIDIELLEAGFC